MLSRQTEELGEEEAKGIFLQGWACPGLIGQARLCASLSPVFLRPPVPSTCQPPVLFSVACACRTHVGVTGHTADPAGARAHARARAPPHRGMAQTSSETLEAYGRPWGPRITAEVNTTCSSEAPPQFHRNEAQTWIM